jgi:hypothetical protein
MLFCFVVSACTIETTTNKPIVDDFDSCVAVEKIVMDSYPAQCQHDGIRYYEDISDDIYRCTEESRTAEYCPEIYIPVCATVNVVCITEPCDPIKKTFPNSCEACLNELVEGYSFDACE